MSRLLIVSTFALAAAVPLAPAIAQADGYYASDSESSITVTAPRMRHEGRSASGAPIRRIETDSVVYTGDLDLRSRSGRRALDLRIEAAANEACDFLDQHYPMSDSLDNPRACRTGAVASAQAQVRDAVERAAMSDDSGY